MDARPFVKAANDMGSRFIGLLDTLSAVSAVTTMDVRHKDPPTLLKDALDILVQHQDLEQSAVFLTRGDHLEYAAGTDFTHLLHQAGDDAAAECRATVPLGAGLVGEAAASGEPRYSPACTSAEMLGSTAGAADGEPGSVLCMPIPSGGTVVGVTAICHPDRDRFQDWHRHVLTLFCAVIGHMLANGEALRRLEEAVEERTRQLQLALEEAQDLRRRYQELSTVDELTGLHNRRFFYPEAEAAVARAIRHGHPLCVLVMDLDNFKDINDGFGHAAGDGVLCSVADTLRQYTREGDILSRTGGEEFVLALPNTGREGARVLAERIRHSIEGLRWPEVSADMCCTASIGIACLDGVPDGDARQRLERLMHHGDQAMYRCKRDGRNRVAVY